MIPTTKKILIAELSHKMTVNEIASFTGLEPSQVSNFFSRNGINRKRAVVSKEKIKNPYRYVKDNKIELTEVKPIIQRAEW